MLGSDEEMLVLNSVNSMQISCAPIFWAVLSIKGLYLNQVWYVKN